MRGHLEEQRDKSKEQGVQTLLENVSRRHFLGGMFSAGAFVLAARLAPTELFAQAAAAGFKSQAETAALHPSVYLGIEPDGTVFIVTHRSEMGTGIRTSLPLVAADELDADWKRVKVEQAIGDVKYGDQNTDGSRSIRDFYDPFRHAGASARAMLIGAAAAQWNVPASECSTDLHEVVHRATNRRLGYGALVPAASKLPVPKPGEVQFKAKSAWRYVGKEQPIYDLSDIVTGKAEFGMDLKQPGMVYASIERPPVYGGKVTSVDDKAALAVAGVSQTVAIDPFKPPHGFQPLGGVAVIANSTWAAQQGRKKLTVNWDLGPHATYDSAQYKQELINAVHQPGKPVRNLGDVDKEFAKGGKMLEATYYTPLLAHASMEPPVAIAEYRDGKVTCWTSVQNPQAAQECIAAAVGIKKEDVTCHTALLGGGFGRKSKPDFAAEAAVLSKKLGKPVKVVWTREEDVKFDFYHSTAAVYVKAAVDGKGKPTAWLTRSAFPPIASTFEDGAKYGLDLEHAMGLSDLPYDLDNIRAENAPASAHLRIGWFRAVCNNYHLFATGSFVDELAHAAGRDTLEYMLDLIGSGKNINLSAQMPAPYFNYGAPMEKYPVDTRRLRKVLEVAGEKSNWGKRKPGGGWGIGIAAHRSFNSYVASVVEVQVDSAGKVTIPRIDQVVDAGLVINPERARSQFEGAAVMGAGLAMFGEITAAGGRVQQSNFNDFRVARMTDAPRQVNVTIVDTDNLPTGIGEPGTPPVIPALANAIFAATGKRVRELPLIKAKLV